MACSEPVLLGGAFPCGKCAACLSQRRRTWAHRIMLEAYGHEGRSSFVTLTYGEAQVPTSLSGLPTLEASHHRDFIKRLRKKNRGIRYFAVGEYGEISERPHYHYALFGMATCPGGPHERIGKGLICVCETCSAVRTTWGFGHTLTLPLTPARAMYLSAYVVKKMTHLGDPRLSGREPEFSRMSLFPGIGALALQPVVSELKKYGLPVPVGLRHNNRILPLGRYLRRKIAEEISDGTDEGMAAVLNSREALAKNIWSLSLLRKYAWDNSEKPLAVYKQIAPLFTQGASKDRPL